MRRSSVVGLAGLLCLLLLPSPAMAQQTSGSSIVGVVRDSSGAVLPGVTVEAASPVLIEKVKTAVSNEQGLFRIVSLPAGTYTITFTLAGFGAVRREGVELPPSFAATINADMKVGAIEETIVVTGASPLVDVQTVTTAVRLPTEQLNAIPTSHNNFNMATLMPAVVAPPNVQDVGGSKGEFGGRGVIHGGKQGDMRYMTDGMQTNGAYGAGNGNGFYMNPASAADLVIESGSGGSAEYATSGLSLNLIPKDGGNKFSGSLFGTFLNGSLTGNNLRSDITNRGLTSTNGVSLIYDAEFGLGGPVKHDKLWFFTSEWLTGTDNTFPNYYFNSSPNPLLYVPDTARPASASDRNKSAQLRMTWQASPKNKFTLSANEQYNCTCPNNEVQNLAPEAVMNVVRQPDFLIQATWNSPVTNKFLLDAGASYLDFQYRYELQPGASADSISVKNSATGITYGLPASWSDNPSPNISLRGSASYVTPSHLLKAGIYYKWLSNGQTSFRSNSETSYTFNGNTPNQITEYASPLTVKRLGNDMGIYLQDRWTMGRLTLSPGLRFDYFHGSVPAQALPADRFLPVRSFGEVDCVPCWKDLNPRFAAAYDVFGDGKTALSASIGRYVAGEVASTAAANDPAATVVNSVNRSWTDTNGNLFPDCDLLNPALQTVPGGDTCGKISSANFGIPVPATHYDPSVLNGWGARGYNWRTSVEVKRQLMDGLAVTAGWYHAWYGNFLVTQNLNTLPSEYDPYCVNVPNNVPGSSLLPGGGGYQECGLADLNPTFFGQAANNYVTFASNFGKETEVYNGGDLTVNARFKNGAFLQGGMNVGDSTVTQVNAGAVSASHTNTCFIVNTPQDLLYCDVNPPYLVQFKIIGSYPLPWNLQLSGNYQSLPGPDIGATWAAPNSATTLGRAFSGGATATVPLFAPFSNGREKRLNQVDLRIARRFTAGKLKATAEFDLYNVLNADSVLSNNTTFGTQFTQPTEILQARLAKFGLNLQF
jgi:hypothetical protein